MSQKFQGLQFDIDKYSWSLTRNRINFIWRPQIDSIVCCKFPRCYDSNVFVMWGKTALSLQSEELKSFQLWSHA